jgi:hypothetical protein
MRIAFLAASLAAALLAAPAFADGPAAAPPSPPKLIKGTIVLFDATAQSLTVKVSDSQSVTVGMLPNTNIVYDEMRSLADIKEGDFVGSAALKGADGKLHAQEVHIFPASMRGAGEGQYGMGDANPNRSMTNATVSGVTRAPTSSKRSMTNAMVAKAPGASGAMALTFHGASDTGGVCSGPAAQAAKDAGCTGSAEIVVAPGVPVVALVPGDRSLLLPGKAVSMFVVTGKDGKPVALGMTVENKGVKPLN